MTQRQHGPAGLPHPYRGEDRRLRPAPREGSAPGRAVLVALLAVLLGVLALTTALPAQAQVTYELLRVVRVALLAGAGLLCLVLWRLSGRSRAALLGVALLVLGVLAESAAALAPLLHGAAAGHAVPSRTGPVVAGVVAGLMVLWARRAPAVDATARPVRLVLMVVLLLVPVVLLAVSGADPFVAGSGQAAVPSVLLAAMWAGLALLERRDRDARPTGRPSWVLSVLTCLSAAAALDAIAALGVAQAAGAGAVLALAAAVLAVHGAAATLLLSLSDQSRDLLRLTVQTHDHEQHQRSERERAEERLHEVRGVLAGLHGAAATLRKYEDRLDPGVRRRLEDAVTGELRRLEHLVDPTLVVPGGPVVLADALAPVLVAEQELGARVETDLAGAVVLGRGADVATIAGALLVNARRHAPGSPVRVRAERGEGETRLLVEDRGPGVPLDQRSAVFDRGERAGATVPGSGLGLFTAARLATEMGGTLQVHARPGGGACFVLSLPAAPSGCIDLDEAPTRGGAQVVPAPEISRVRLPQQRDEQVGVR